MKTIAKYYLKYWKCILISMILLVGEALCELELPGYMSDIITYGVATNDMSIIKEYGIKMMLYTLGSAAFAIGVGYFGSKAASNIARDIRRDTFSKVMQFATEEYNQFSLSSLVTRCTNDILQVQTFTTMFLRQAMFVPVMGIGGIFKALKYSSGISQVQNLIIVGLLLVVVAVVIVLVLILPKYIKMQKQVDNVNQVVNDELNGIMEIRAFNNEEYESGKFTAANKDLTKTTLFINRMTAQVIPAMNLVMYLIAVAVLVFAAKYASNIGQIANMMAFIQYAMQIIISFIIVSMAFILLPRSLVSTRRLSEILNKQVSIKNKEWAENETGKIVKGDVQFHNVSYSFGDNKVLTNISFTAEKGQVTAIIGSTGSGKSTLVNLIPRLMDLNQGEILINGVDVRNINLTDLRNSIGFVPQNAILFSGSVESNIKYSNNEMTSSQFSDAARIAQVDSFIQEMQDGYSSMIAQGGSNISGGQKQRIAIARALAKKASINIFDDSFSALDYKTDSALRGALRVSLKDSTTIIVAQRVGTIMDADKIIVLNNGKIVGEGTHQELIKNCKMYLEIVKSQFPEEEVFSDR